MVWGCEQVHEFWHKTTTILSDVIGCPIPTDPIVLLLNDDFKLHLLKRQRKMWLAGSTATDHRGWWVGEGFCFCAVCVFLLYAPFDTDCHTLWSLFCMSE